ncbi:MAG: winged helix-turn-helix transcriptional regulator [Bdellovibrionales bacterium]|nr:winged helix-turn-helix transcriptional regulator [Bdellovibrionales bacterium]
MLEKFLGGTVAEKVLLYIQNYGDGYAYEISKCFDISVSMVQKQLSRFEEAGVLVSRLRGKVRIYTWNPRSPFKAELNALLGKALALLPNQDRKKYFMDRTRPRRAGKAL